MNDLTVIENELVPVYETSTGEKVVYGSELHEVLEVKSRFNDWIRNRLKDCDAEENSDYESFTKNLVSGGQAKEYLIKLDTAKEMAMLERNEKGKQVRRYFISVEKKYKQTSLLEQRLSVLDRRVQGAETAFVKYIGQQETLNSNQLEFNGAVTALLQQITVNITQGKNSAVAAIPQDRVEKKNLAPKTNQNYQSSQSSQTAQSIQPNTPNDAGGNAGNDIGRDAGRDNVNVDRTMRRRNTSLQDWICVRTEIIGSESRMLAKELGCSHNEAIGLLVRFWIYASENMNDRGIPEYTDKEDMESAINLGRCKNYSKDDAIKALIQFEHLRDDGSLNAADWIYWQEPIVKLVKQRASNRDRKKRERRRRGLEEVADR